MIFSATNFPRLTNPACDGHWWLFDQTIPEASGPTPPEVQQARRTCIELCAQCPALDSCRQWVRSLPHNKRPEGVVAGLVINRRIRKEIA
jgi:WhiB family redox-sensing transcriptional regulator